MCKGARIKEIQPKVEHSTSIKCHLYTDESKAYNGVLSSGRKHSTVKHSEKEYARDDDGDGINEVHCNSCEGLWTGVRNFIRIFRGVHKRWLAQYIATFENSYNYGHQLEDVLRAMIIPNYYLEYYASP